MLDTYYWARKGTPPASPPAGGGSTFDTAVLALSNLRCYYKLDDASSTMSDSGAGAHHGTYTGSPTQQVTGPLSSGTNYGVTFDGATQYGTATHHADFNLGTSDYSIGLWLKDSSWPAGYNYLFCHNGDGDSTYWEVRQEVNTNIISGRNGGGTDVRSGTGTKNDGNWHWLVLTVDRSVGGGNGSAQWYLDGAADGSPTTLTDTTTALDASVTLYVARRQSTGYASVTLSRLFLAATLLSSSDVSTLWSAR